MANVDSAADIAAFIDDAEERWGNVPAWLILDDEDGRGIVRTKDGRIIAETIVSGGTHEDAVRIVQARSDIHKLCQIAAARVQRLESENAGLRARLAQLVEACRNVLTTEPPPLKEVASAWSMYPQMSQYQDWFHRQFNINQVAELLEHSNDDNG